jgi:hypothetical protein
MIDYDDFISDKSENSLLRFQIQELEAKVIALDREVDDILKANISGIIVLKVSEDLNFRNQIAREAISAYRTNPLKWPCVSLLQNSISLEPKSGFEWVCLSEVLSEDSDTPLNPYDYLNTSIDWKNWASWLSKEEQLTIQEKYRAETQTSCKPLTDTVSSEVFNNFFEWWKNSELGGDLKKEEEFQYAQAFEIALANIKSRVLKKII